MPGTSITNHSQERVGSRLAAHWLKFAPFAWTLTTALFAALLWTYSGAGWMLKPPSERLMAIERKLDRVVRVTEANALWMCSSVTAEQALFLRLDCDDLRREGYFEASLRARLVTVPDMPTDDERGERMKLAPVEHIIRPDDERSRMMRGRGE